MAWFDGHRMSHGTGTRGAVAAMGQSTILAFLGRKQDSRQEGLAFEVGV